MKAKLILMGILIGVLLATGAFSLALGASVPHRTTVNLGSSELAAQPFRVEQTNAATGGVITLTLGASAVTGEWQEQAEVSDPSVIEQTHNKLLLPESPGISGEQLSQSWTFRTLKEGSTTVRLNAEPPEGSGLSVHTFELALVVIRK